MFLNHLNHLFLPGQPTERDYQYLLKISRYYSCVSGALVHTTYAQQSNPSLCPAYVDTTVAFQVTSPILISAFQPLSQHIFSRFLRPFFTQVNLPHSEIDPIFAQNPISICNTRSIFEFKQQQNVVVSTDPEVTANHSQGPKKPHPTSITSYTPPPPALNAHL